MALSPSTDDQQQSTERPSRNGPTLAKTLAPEDVRPGDYVTLLHEFIDVPSFYWCCDATLLAPEEPVWIRYLARSGGMPMRVKSVCLPFVLVKRPWGDQRAIDLRKYRIARLTKRYAARAWKAYKKAKPRHGCRP